MSDWRIHKREPSCTRCERAFEEGEVFFSVLPLEEDRLQRQDLCAGCFEVPRSTPDLFYWRTHHRTDRRARFAVDFEAIEELFLRLEPGPERGPAARLQELRYLLALLLLRKKRLKLVGVRRNADGEILCVRRPRRQEEYLVTVFELDSERAAVLKAELARVFEGAGVEALAEPAGSEGGGAGGTPVAEVGSSEPSR